ncbi:MAG: nodulation protein S NodS, partial [Candidatus Thermoplasmatota archaeon]|nr:nodulation protein S NodS [Candidatus Thermoplasmatota archaeon]
RNKWLVKGGIFAFGVDHYLENKESLEWPEKVGVRMTTFSESEWVSLVNSAGLDVLKVFKANENEDWPGTLVIVARS